MKTTKKISRKSFLLNSVKGAAGLALLPHIVTSCSSASVNDKIRIAHIGLGSRGFNELNRYFLPLEKALNVAVCDVYKNRRDLAAKTIDDYYNENIITAPKCDTYLDYEEMLQRDDIDAVNIVSPDHWHVPMAINAAKAGKHIMLAKPLGLSYPNYVKLHEAVTSNDVRFHYSTQQRASYHMTLAREMIREGVIGDISKVDVWCPGTRNGEESPVCRPVDIPTGFDYDRWTGPAPLHPYCPERVNDGSWFFIHDYSIGFLAGWGAHPLDIMVWCIKEHVSGIYRCQGTGQSWLAGSLFDNINSWDVNLDFKNGPRVHFVSLDRALEGALDDEMTQRERNGTTFHGSNGWISVSRNAASSSIPELDRMLNDVPRRGDGKIQGENFKIAEIFVEIINGNREELCPLDDAIISDTISHMSNFAIRLQREITWDPVNGKVTNDPEANSLFTRGMRPPYQV